jgi:hypothetical protein
LTPARTWSIKPAKSRAASASEMWIVAMFSMIPPAGCFFSRDHRRVNGRAKGKADPPLREG